MLALFATAVAFTPATTPMRITQRASVPRMDDIPQTRASTVVESTRENFVCSFEIPKKGIAEYGTVEMNFKPLLATESEVVVVRQQLPFGLKAAPAGRVVRVTADGKGEGTEKEGDILLLHEIFAPGRWRIDSKRPRESTNHAKIMASLDADGENSPYCKCVDPVTGCNGLHAAVINGYLELTKVREASPIER